MPRAPRTSRRSPEKDTSPDENDRVNLMPRCRIALKTVLKTRPVREKGQHFEIERLGRAEEALIEKIEARIHPVSSYRVSEKVSIRARSEKKNEAAATGCWHLLRSGNRRELAVNLRIAAFSDAATRLRDQFLRSPTTDSAEHRRIGVLFSLHLHQRSEFPSTTDRETAAARVAEGVPARLGARPRQPDAPAADSWSDHLPAAQGPRRVDERRRRDCRGSMDDARVLGLRAATEPSHGLDLGERARA